jgi:hypothetical protein
MRSFLKDLGRRLLGLDQQRPAPHGYTVKERCDKVRHCACGGADDEDDGRHAFHRSCKNEEEQQKLLEQLKNNPYILEAKSGHFGNADGSKKFYYVSGHAVGHLQSPILHYSASELTKPSKPGCWDVATIEVLLNNVKVGSYDRNYHSYGTETFCPFIWKGKEYALYSKDYTSTRVMTLPDCQDLCGEDRNSWGFCPVEYYVPINPFNGESAGFGFVAGCVWGDDSSWKIQYLDLGRVDEGILVRDNRFGYIELPRKMYHLKDAICFYWGGDGSPPDNIYITTERCWDRETGKSHDENVVECDRKHVDEDDE